MPPKTYWRSPAARGISRPMRKLDTSNYRRATRVVPDRNPVEYRLRGAVALVAAPTVAVPRVGRREGVA